MYGTAFPVLSVALRTPTVKPISRVSWILQSILLFRAFVTQTNNMFALIAKQEIEELEGFGNFILIFLHFLFFYLGTIGLVADLGGHLSYLHKIWHEYR